MGKLPKEFGVIPFCIAIIICIWLKSPEPEKLPLGKLPFVDSESGFS